MSMDTPTAHINLLLVEDHQLLREALALRLMSEPDFTRVDTAKDGDDAMVRIRYHCPDIVLMDIEMPGSSCFDVADRIGRQEPSVKIAFLSGHFLDGYIDAALDVGAVGYIIKTESGDHLVAALRRIDAGEHYFSPQVRDRLVTDDTGNARSLGVGHSRLASLTPRELDVLRHVAGGLSKKEIAGVMSISVNTVSNHTARLMDKLNIHDRVKLARMALRESICVL